MDKKSNAGLSEAINSMFKWYKQSEVCFVYLADYVSDVFEKVAFAKCRWFTRGFTLQELIAPTDLTFFSSSWKWLGDKDTIEVTSAIVSITDIDYAIVAGWMALDSCSVAARMSWAAHRETSRLEDTAYCLLGLFNIAMPLLYGEGAQAFRRLQEEIVKNIDDDSIIAWKVVDSPVFRRFLDVAGIVHPLSLEGSPFCHPFAIHPSAFTDSGIFYPYSTTHATDDAHTFSVGARGVFCHGAIVSTEYEKRDALLLRCRGGETPSADFIGIYVQALPEGRIQYARVFPGKLCGLDSLRGQEDSLKWQPVLFPRMLPRFRVEPNVPPDFRSQALLNIDKIPSHPADVPGTLFFPR